MFEFLKTLFSGDERTLLTDAYDRFLAMLDAAAGLLETEDPHVLGAGVPEEVASQARAVDKQSNRDEREIRKLLVAHLAFAPTDSAACLVLMSVAKDGERLIDECRALLLLGKEVEAPIPESYRTTIHERTKKLVEVLREARRAFAGNHREAALAIVESEKPFVSALEAVQKHVLADDELAVRQGVLVYQAMVCQRRIRAHIGNIASSVVMPLHRIDFAKRRFVEEARKEIEQSKS